MNLTTSYLGLSLSHPFIAGASPMSARLDTVKRLEDAGCAAIVLHSLFEEQITMAQSGKIHHRDPLEAAFAESLASFPSAGEYPLAPDEYMTYLRRVKDAVAVPVIASLNGTTNETWLREAERIQRAGADALELNIYHVVTDRHATAVAIEERLRHAVTEVKRLLHIPVAIKLTPFFTAFGNLAHQLDEAGADGLVLFNRFYQPDIDIRTMTATPEVVLSRSSELLLRLRWLAILHGRIKANLAASGGVETSDDCIKALLAGADAVQMVSAILRHGPAHFKRMRDGLERWMEWHHFDDITGFRGRLSLHNTADPEAHERGNYIRVLHSWQV